MCMALCNSLGPWWAVLFSAASLAVAEWQRRQAKRLRRENTVLRESLRPPRK